MRLTFKLPAFPRKLAVFGLTGLVLATAAATSASAQNLAARHGMTGAQYQAEFNKYTNKGYRLTDVSSYTVQGTAMYAAIWAKTGGPSYVARHGIPADKYQKVFNKMTGKGFVPAFNNATTVNGTTYFAAQWDKSGGGFVARHGLSSGSYQSEFKQYTASGYRLVSISGYEFNGKARYSAVWKKQNGPAWVARHGMTGAQYQAAFDQYISQGFKPAHVDGYTVNGTPYFAAIWEKSGGAHVARHGLSGAAYQAAFNKWTAKGYRLVDISGYTAGGKVRYAAIWRK